MVNQADIIELAIPSVRVIRSACLLLADEWVAVNRISFLVLAAQAVYMLHLLQQKTGDAEWPFFLVGLRVLRYRSSTCFYGTIGR